MRWLENISISAKILLSLGLLAVFSVGVAVKGVDALSSLNGRTQSIVGNDAQGLVLAMEMRFQNAKKRPDVAARP